MCVICKVRFNNYVALVCESNMPIGTMTLSAGAADCDAKLIHYRVVMAVLWPNDDDDCVWSPEPENRLCRLSQRPICNAHK